MGVSGVSRIEKDDLHGENGHETAQDDQEEQQKELP